MTNNCVPFGAGHVTPESDDAAGLGSNGGTTVQGTSDSPDSASADADARKRDATLVAEFARLGHGLIELADGSFLATRWNCCRALPDLQAARTFLRQIGGARA